MASGTIDGDARRPTTSTSPTRSRRAVRARPLPLAGLHRPRTRRLSGPVDANRPAPSARWRRSESYPARKGHDQFYGYGRVNMAKARRRPASTAGARDPARGRDHLARVVRAGRPRASRRVDVEGEVYARGAAYTLPGLRRSRLRPEQRAHDRHAAGRLRAASRRLVRRHDAHTRRPFDGVARRRSTSPQLKARFPPGTATSTAPSRGPAPPNVNGRPNTEPVRLHGQGRGRTTTEAGDDADRRGPAQRSTCTATSDLLPGLPRSDRSARRRRRVLAARSPTSTATTATS